MKLIIVSGMSSTGKTTLANKLSKDLKIPVFHKDDYKERRFDELGKLPNPKQMNSIEVAAKKALCSAIDAAAEQNESLIVESNFTYKQRPMLRPHIRPNMEVVELFCSANGFRVLKRYIDRNRSGNRHKGHRDTWWYTVVALQALGSYKRIYRPLGFGKKVLVIDTNHFEEVDYDAIREFVATD